MTAEMTIVSNGTGAKPNDRRRQSFYLRQCCTIYGVLLTMDVLLLLLVIAPCSIIFWVSTWSMIQKLHPHTAATSVCLSAILFVFFHVAQPIIYKTVRQLYTEHKLSFYLTSRAYLYLFSTSGVIFWNYCWEDIIERMPELDPYVTAFSSLASFLILRFMKCLPNISGGVGGVGEERTAEDVFLFPNLCNVQWKKNKFLYLLDSVFSVMIVGILVILVWRGTWCLLDNYIYPDNEEKSGWVSLIIGYGIVFITFLLQPLMKILIRKYRYWRRLVIIDIYVVISFCGTINIWRGMWMVYDKYCQLDGLLSSVLVHFTTFLILVLFNSSNTLLVRGVYIDAEENAENCIEFPCYYFRLIFQEKQKKKAIANLNLQHQKDTLLRNNAGTEDIKEKEMDILDSNGKVKALTDNSTSAAKSIVNSTLEKRETNESRIAVTDGAAVSSNSYEYDTDQYSTENGTAVKSINRV